jgi:hypothetical protein
VLRVKPVMAGIDLHSRSLIVRTAGTHRWAN